MKFLFTFIILIAILSFGWGIVSYWIDVYPITFQSHIIIAGFHIAVIGGLLYLIHLIWRKPQ